MGFGRKTGTQGQGQDISRTCPGSVQLRLDVGDDLNGFVVALSKILKSRTNIFGEERVMVTESKVEEFCSVRLTNARAKGCRRFVKESRMEEHSTRRDRNAADMAHA